MIDRKEFSLMRKELEKYDKQRELAIKKSRDVIKLSKQIIYSLHRNNVKEAEGFVKEIKKEVKELDNFMGNNVPKTEGFYSSAIMEYVEAKAHYHYVVNKELIRRSELDVSVEDYLLGIADLSGELTRLAINSAIKGNFKDSEDAKDMVQTIYEEMMLFDFSNGLLRKKFDKIKYDLNKLEDLMLELKLRNKK